MDRVRVEVDPDLKDLMPGFLERKRADLLIVRSALAGCDFVTIARLAHMFKGEGGSYGLDAMTELGGKLESSASNEDLVAVRKLTDQLSAYLESVELV